MRSRRFPAVELSGWRSRVVDAYPRLFPDARPVTGPDGPELACRGRPEVPDGWRALVELACARLAVAVGDGPGEVAVRGMREKFGTLRLDVAARGLTDAAHEAVELAVDLAEARSAHACSTCGRPARLWSNGGWIDTRCDDHGEGRPLPRGDHVIVTTRFERGGAVTTARKYLPDEDRFVAVPVPKED